MRATRSVNVPPRIDPEIPAALMRVMSGQYDQASRAAASY
jgi:predicted MarR family transcription regulator